MPQEWVKMNPKLKVSWMVYNKNQSCSVNCIYNLIPGTFQLFQYSIIVYVNYHKREYHRHQSYGLINRTRALRELPY